MRFSRKLRTELLYLGNAQSPLGGVKFVGTINGSPGTGRPNMRILGAYAFVFLLEGSGEFGDASGLRRRVKPGDVICVFPDVAHFYGPGPGEEWHEIYITFEGLMFDLWRRQKVLVPERPIWKLQPVAPWFQRIKSNLCRSAVGGAEEAFRHLSRFQMLVADMKMANRSGGSETARTEPWLAEACRVLEKASGRPPNLQALARELGFSYENFRKKFGHAMDTSPLQYHQARLIDQACTQLVNSQDTGKVIAERLGFCDEFHFSKVFKKRLGISPRAFRAKALGQGDNRSQR